MGWPALNQSGRLYNCPGVANQSVTYTPVHVHEVVVYMYNRNPFMHVQFKLTSAHSTLIMLLLLFKQALVMLGVKISTEINTT